MAGRFHSKGCEIARGSSLCMDIVNDIKALHMCSDLVECKKTVAKTVHRRLQKRTFKLVL